MFNLIIALLFSLTCLLPAFAGTSEDKSPGPSTQAGTAPGAASIVSNEAPQATQSQSPTDATPLTEMSQNSTTKQDSPPTGTEPSEASASPEPSYDAISKKAIETGIPSEASQGPLLSDRRHIREWLVSVKQRGVGISFYMPLYEDIETGVRAGVPEQVTHSKVQSICAKIAAQVKESSRLQRWRPVKPIKEKPERPVYWIGERRDDDALKVKANDWYNNALNLLGDKDDKERREVQSRLWRQRDAYLKDMRERWGGPKWEGYGNNDNLKYDNQVVPLYRAPRKDLKGK